MKLILQYITVKFKIDRFMDFLFYNTNIFLNKSRYS